MGHNGCDGSQASGPWAIGSGYRFNINQIHPKTRDLNQEVSSSWAY